MHIFSVRKLTYWYKSLSVQVFEVRRFDLVIPSIIRTIHYRRILYHQCLDCAIKMASGKASLAFDSNYQQVFQYPLQYIPTNPINVCAVILDSLPISLSHPSISAPQLQHSELYFYPSPTPSTSDADNV